METIKVRRANKILRVNASEKKKYLNLGYDVIGEKGKVLEHNTQSVTVAEYNALKAKCEALEQENAALRKKRAN